MNTAIVSQFPPLAPLRVSAPDSKEVGRNPAPSPPPADGVRSAGGAEARPPAQALSGPEKNRPMDEKTLSEAVSRLNDLAQTVRRELQFSLDDESGRMLVKVIDSETEEVIRQIPPEEILALLRHLKEGNGGGLFQESA